MNPAGRRLRAVLAALGLTVHALAVMPAHGQRRLDAAGVHVCKSMEQLIFDLRSRTVSTAAARQRLTLIYDIARSSSNLSLRQIAEAHMHQVASADDSMLLVMAEHFRAVCR